MATKSYKKKSEVAHHASKASGKDVATTLKRFLTLLATLGSLETGEKLFKLINIEVVFGSGLAGRNGGGHVTCG